ncbi:uncharacterized protein LOC118347988 [Juglans regia]|uniref:Uncharacterized protein LOC118347988 n=1 Tax=Juglans regia TaxID=51240 RepID=A0A6P9E8R0_JUGRE|nr:uncharacterized protein LOC118347988 [Juglans regia]
MKKFWTALWKLQVPHKVKVFAWRACKDSLSTKANLIKRKLDIEGKCSFCQHPLEDLRHVLILCPSIYEFLRSRFLVFQNGGQISSFLTAAMDILFKGTSEELADFFLMVWAFWFRRNKMVHKQIALPPQQVIGFAFTNKLHSVVVRHQLGLHSSKYLVYRWSAPPEDSLKLNIDGALFFYLNKAGMGVVLRNHMGEVLMASSRVESVFLEPEQVEAVALLRGLQLCMRLGIPKLIIKSDCLFLEEEINRSSESNAAI